MPRKGPQRTQGVFLNVPYDRGYEPRFLALIAAIVCLGRRPYTTLEIPETGDGRLERLFHQIDRCAVSIHDMSRVGLPVRFNMPFELGLACAIARYSSRRPRHRFVTMEAREHRLDRTLSDMKGRDVLVHEGKPRLIVNRVLDVLGTRSTDPSARDIHAVRRRLAIAVRRLQKESGESSLFSRTMYRATVQAAVRLAQDQGLLH